MKLIIIATSLILGLQAYADTKSETQATATKEKFVVHNVFKGKLTSIKRESVKDLTAKAEAAHTTAKKKQETWAALVEAKECRQHLDEWKHEIMEGGFRGGDFDFDIVKKSIENGLNGITRRKLEAMKVAASSYLRNQVAATEEAIETAKKSKPSTTAVEIPAAILLSDAGLFKLNIKDRGYKFPMSQLQDFYRALGGKKATIQTIDQKTITLSKIKNKISINNGSVTYFLSVKEALATQKKMTPLIKAIIKRQKKEK